MEMIDVHAHLTDERFNDVEDVLARAGETGINKVVCSAFNIDSSKKAVELASKYKNVFANVGLHPENVDEFDNQTLLQIEDLCKSQKVVAVGEIGLDYHFVQDNKQKQKEIFIEQMNLANRLQLPVVIHCRDAMGDLIEIIKQNPPLKNSLLHCYSGSVESAKILMKYGFSFSFGGVVTFKNAKNVVEVVKELPLERILLETDCPYMTPVPFRGQRNEPKNVVYVADAISKIKNISIEEVAKVTTQNAERLFNI